MINFVNTKKFAEIAHLHLTKKGYKASIITGNIEAEERDKIMEKFRRDNFSLFLQQTCSQEELTFQI